MNDPHESHEAHDLHDPHEAHLPHGPHFLQIDALIEKLRPLMPGRVQRWQRALQNADPELRVLLERQVRDAARRLLRSAGSPILLNLPRAGEVKGPINLGTVVYAGDRYQAGISPSELLQHMCVVGRSGAGKTNAVFHLLLQLTDRRIPWVFLDVKRTARHLLPLLGGRVTVYTPGRPVRPLGFNPFAPPPNLEPLVYLGYAVDALARAYTLGDGSISVLQKTLAALYGRGVLSPTVAQILEEMGNLPAKGRAGTWTVSARRALESLALAGIGSGGGGGGVGGGGGGGQADVVRGLAARNVIVELDGLNENARQFLVPLLCLWVYLERLGQPVREQLNLVLVLEEAHHFVGRSGTRSGASVMDMILRQCREVGIGVISVAQHPHLLSSSVLGNSYTTLALNLKDVPDVNRAAGVLGLSDTEKQVLLSLPVGHAVVKLQDRYRRPFLVRIPAVAVRKGAVQDRDLAEGRLIEGAHSGLNTGFSPPVDTSGRVRVSDKVLAEEELRFLEDVLARPDDGVRARYQRLRLSGDKGNRLKTRLLRAGWLDAETVRVGLSRKVLLRLSRAGRKYLGLGSQPPGTGGLAHEYWRRWWARRLEADGFEVQVEAARNGGYVDVLASRGKALVGVEVETGKSNAVANVRRCLHAGLRSVLVVVTDAAVLPRIERDLAAAGLLVPGRVLVQHAWDPPVQGLPWSGVDEDSTSLNRPVR